MMTTYAKHRKSKFIKKNSHYKSILINSLNDASQDILLYAAKHSTASKNDHWFESFSPTCITKKTNIFSDNRLDVQQVNYNLS